MTVLAILMGDKPRKIVQIYSYRMQMVQNFRDGKRGRYELSRGRYANTRAVSDL